MVDFLSGFGFCTYTLRWAGKSFGSYYFLFRLLASGQSVFFINSVTETTYFSGEGAQTTQAPPRSRLREVIEKSWVIIDVEDGIDWSCPMVFRSARGVVWTSSPQKTRMHRFCKHFLTLPWYMKPWSTKEIAALTCVLFFYFSSNYLF